MAQNQISWLQWLIHTNNDLQQLWMAQPSYLLSQAVFLLAGIITFIHALSKGGRWPWFWLCTLLHGLYADNLWHFVLPEFDNFWHSQTPVMFLGARQPLHILFLYPAFIYNAAYAVSKLNLPKYAEPFAVGLVTVLIDIPYDIVSVKFVHWTWHDTDPNVFDRHYWVPWNSYYFHATFAAGLYFMFQVTRSSVPKFTGKWESAGFKSELKSTILSALLGMPLGVLGFVPIYHPLHDTYKVHSEVTFFVIFAIFGVIVLVGLLGERENVKNQLSKIDYVLLLHLALHFAFFWSLAAFGHPEREWSLGLHEPVGNCQEQTTLTTPFGQTLTKRKYFCAEDYDEGYFDFNCVRNQRPAHGSSWYVICGTPFENRVEYITVISTVLVVAAGVFYGIYFKNKSQVPAKKLKYK